ncbi:MAG: hypothetical protein FWD78_06745 [Treponema sp.]|nr:hypothetical protein [Treponema sp.]
MKSGVKAIICLVILLLTLVPGASVSAYYATYKEQYYRLFHLHYNQYPDDTMENIYYLEKALQADFCNPLYAMALIENETQWEKYRYLFMMDVNLKLIEQYIQLGNKWNKRNAYFYNAPWKDINLEALDTAEKCFNAALFYWNDAKDWAEKSNDKRFRFLYLDRVKYWEDEAYRIENKSLDYEKIIKRELGLLQQVREKFQAMDNQY